MGVAIMAASVPVACEGHSTYCHEMMARLGIDLVGTVVPRLSLMRLHFAGAKPASPNNPAALGLTVCPHRRRSPRAFARMSISSSNCTSASPALVAKQLADLPGSNKIRIKPAEKVTATKNSPST
jgi:hypothetical protein